LFPIRGAPGDLRAAGRTHPRPTTHRSYRQEADISDLSVPERELPFPAAASAIYQSRLEAYGARRDAMQRRWNLIANVRLAAFLALAAVCWLIWRDQNPLLIALGVLIVAAVVALVARHRHLRRERDDLQRLVDVNARARDRALLAWDALPMPPPSGADRTHAYAYDLNIVGPASVAQRVGSPTTRHGWSHLYARLLTSASSAEVAQRQRSVRELASRLDLRQRVEATGRRVDGEIPDPASFLAWAEGPPLLRDRAWLGIVCIASPVALVLLIVLQALGIVPYPLWLVPVSVNVILFQLVGRRVAEGVAVVAPLHRAIAGYRDMFGMIAADEVRSPILRRICETLGSGPMGAMTIVSRLTRISSLAIPRGSLLYYPLQMALLWDAHVLRALEGWKRANGSRARLWLESAGEWEALSALAILAHDHPQWAMPTVNDGQAVIEASGLAHPLIAEEGAVGNDVTAGPAGTFLFVTGSNMAGKSTLLRALGVNAVLAMAGAPTCAQSLSMPTVDVWTCMRVEDSVARGVSFFMAELQRLKLVVDACTNAEERPVLYLLDEILQGTNTGERQIASRRVLTQLIGTSSLGAISSHDLDLVAGTDLDERARKVHFAEQFSRGIEGPVMTFDYTLRPGLATSTNALALMELLGFDVSVGGKVATGQAAVSEGIHSAGRTQQAVDRM